MAIIILVKQSLSFQVATKKENRSPLWIAVAKFRINLPYNWLYNRLEI